jgi:hypothetical protein
LARLRRVLHTWSAGLLDYSDPARQGFEAQLKLDSDGIERAVFTGGDALSSPEQRRVQDGGGWGASPRRQAAPGPTHEGRRRVRQLDIDRMVKNRGGVAYQSQGGVVVGHGQMASRGSVF